MGLTARWTVWAVLITTVYLTDIAVAFLEHQAKFFTESGNLIIESALDANITFRLRGRGHLKINDDGFLSGTALGSSSSNDPNLHAIVEQLRNSVETMKAHFEGNRSVQARLQQLESGRSGQFFTLPRMRNINRRLGRLERTVNALKRSIETDYCSSEPCANGGTCRNELGTFKCTCPPTYEGATCADDRNECAAFAGTDLGCQNGATCENRPGSYLCHCAPGWKGLDCNRRTVDCLAGPPGELCGHGACVQTNDARGYTCVCEQGWRTDGVSVACVVDVDECVADKPHCSMEPAVRCINLPGTYTCGHCPAGYEGNGYYCRDVDECAENNGGCSTAPWVQCMNTRGSHHCAACPLGWEGDGRTCTRATTQPANSDSSAAAQTGVCSLCHSIAVCDPTSLSMPCICPMGYSGNGIGSHGCQATGDVCSRNSCYNGGTCVADTPSGYRCVCTPAWKGVQCTVEAAACSSSPCQNGGTCVSSPVLLAHGRFNCRCPPTHTGTVCDVEVRTCGGVLRGAAGIIRYPLVEGSYMHNQRCAWLIQTNETQVLNITFTRFSLEASGECRYDWLQMHDGMSSSAHLIGRFCGGALPRGGNIVSTHNSLYLWFRSDNSTSHDGFELEWNSIAPVCGGYNLITTYGTITSPGSPGNYPQNRDCTWLLAAPNNKRIELHFFQMQLETHPSCDQDYLAIFDGSVEDRQLARYCNTSHPQPLTSTSNRLTLQFHSDNIGSDAGFQIHYSVIEGIPGCGGIWTQQRGELSSPKSNGGYPVNMQCEYLIRLPSDSRIRINFEDFEMETSSHGCYFDALSLYEGADNTAPLIGRFCGDQMPPMHVSTSNVLALQFTSDSSFSGRGFRLTYETVCGSQYTNTSGIITSPMYPERYDRNIVCTYEILAPPGHAIALDWIDFDVEGFDNECDYDAVSVYHDHIEPGMQPDFRFCGSTKPASQVTTKNILTLELRTDGSLQGRGFKANYSFVDASCGGVIKSLGHDIRPPMADGQYEHNSECTWLIVAPANKVVQLTFNSFDLESSEGCDFDYVQVIDGTPSNGSQIGKYCGTNIPPTDRSNGNVMSLKFSSDFSYRSDGFSVSYDFLDQQNFCGGRLFAPTGTITSPGWESGYPPNKDCIWTIIAPAGQQIELTVASFQLETSYDCSVNYLDSLEIRNGNNANSSLIGRYCGTNIPKTIRSFGNQLYVRFVSDWSISAPGFQLHWDATLTGCGGVLAGVSAGSIVSPNYPLHYAESLYCEWHISTSAGSTLQLRFADLDLEHQSECYFDALDIHDGSDSTAPRLGRYCGSGLPPLINSTTNSVYVRLRTDVSNNGRGFDLHFETNCNNILNEPHGVIQSPNNPFNYPNNLHCQWTIVAPRGNKIQVIFSEFSTETGFYHRGGGYYDYLLLEQLDHDNEVTKQDYATGGMPAPITSFTEKMKLTFVTDHSVSATGFRLEYTILGCGSPLRAPTGVLHTPDYPSAHPHNMDCMWTITSPFNHLIELTMHDYDFHASPNCTTNGVVVSNQANATAEPTKSAISGDTKPSAPHTVHRYCGTAPSGGKPEVITSLSNRLFVHFYANSEYAGRGFNASYRQVPIRCGGKFKNIRGTIQSPNYPLNYDNNLHCEWLIETQDKHNVRLSFVDFGLEEYQHDTVELYSGELADANHLLATLHGSDVSAQTVFNSTSSQMLVVLKTDFSLSMKGFQAKYWSECGTTIVVTDEGGTISSEDVMRHENSVCEWTFTAPNPDDRIVLSFLEYYNNHDLCANRIVIDNANVTLCRGDYHDTPYTSLANHLRMEVLRDEHSTTDAFRFRIAYALVSGGCGNQLHAKQGIVASPQYPRSYPLNTDCVWTISSSPGNRLQINFESFDIAESEHCNEAYVEVRDMLADGTSPGALLGTFCGTRGPATLSAPRLWLKFHSGDTETAGGFMAEYSHERLAESTGSLGEITSPLYPKYDIRSTGQQYRIVAPMRTVVEVKIEQFLNRQDATLTFYDGYNDESLEIGTYTSMPGLSVPNLRSNTNVLFIVWTAPTEALFRITWTAIDEQTMADANSTIQHDTLNCTRNSLVTIGVHEQINITSPGYPYGYGANQDCRWTLAPARDGYHVAVFFTQVDLEDTPNCLSDAIAVSRSDNVAGPFVPLQRFCTPQSNASIYTKIHGDPYLQLTFTSDYYTNRTGFAAIAFLQAGGTLTGPSGTIEKNMTLTEMFGHTCNWLIKVREGRTIRLTLRRLSVKRDIHTQKCDGYLLLRNGHTESSPYLGQGQFCGTELPAESEANRLQTTGNVAVVQYYKGSRNQLDDFALDYEEVGVECGGSIVISPQQSDAQIVHSPNYPNIPHPFSECVWTIRGPPGKTLRIDFNGTFDLVTAHPCTQELVELRDGATEGAPLIGTFCDHAPSTQRTTSNMLRIRYFTQAKLPRNGFIATIQSDICGGAYRDASGFVQSPGFPHPVAPNTNCDYRIHSRPGSTLNITFIVMDVIRMYFEDDCSHAGNRVSVYDVLPSDEGEALNLIGEYCRLEPIDPIVTQSNEVLVRLKTTEPRMLSRGFQLFYNTSIERCGGDVNARSGVIMSPGYPVGRSDRHFCEWRIQVPIGQRVRVDVIDFDLNVELTPQLATRTLVGSRLNFFNDLQYSSRIRTLTGLDQTETIYSSDNIMVITMRSWQLTGHRGFKLNFSSSEATTCMGNLNSDSGTLSSPNNTSSYTCRYQRDPQTPFFEDAPHVGTLALDIRAVENRTSAICTEGMALPFKITDGPKLVYSVPRRCNNGTENVYDTVVTSKQSVIIHARQNVNSLRSYRIDYRVHRCGGVITSQDEYTIVAPPALEGFIEAGEPLHCAWLFTAQPNVRLKVHMNFTAIDCEHERVSVFNGQYASNPLVERVCGNAAGSRNFTDDISGENLLVEFHTTNYRPNSTIFSVRIETNYALCGGLLLAPNYHFSSPGNAAQYPNNMECEWELRARRGYHVGLTFRNRFFVEESDNCTKDSVQINDYDAVGKVEQPLVKLCGRSVPPFINSTGRRMLVTMRSDDRIAGDGFQAVWSENCGGQFTVGTESQDMYSPNYPDSYDHNAFCNYTLVAPADKFINIEFVQFELEGATSRGCEYDNLTVYRLPDWSYLNMATELVGVYCGSAALRTLRFKGTVHLLLRTDPWYERRGFHFRYRLDSCGGLVTNSSTRIQLPPSSVAGEYLPELRCVWNITAPDDKKIVVRIERLQVEANDYCYSDFVDVYEGVEAIAEQRKALLCGNLTGHAPVVNIASNRAVLRFQSDVSTSTGGFEALVMFVRKCDRLIELTEGQPTFELRNLYGEYETSLDCHYRVTGPDGWTIRMEFNEFHVAPCANISPLDVVRNNRDCHCDYVEVRDGGGEFAEPIGENRCGYDLPRNVTSSKNALWVRFVTDTETGSTGFRATLSLERSECGVTHFQLNQTHTQQTLSWPHTADSQYLPNERCQWLFEAPYGSLIVLSFDRLDIEDDNTSCSKDYLEVSDNGNRIYQPEGLHSGTVFSGGKSAMTNPTFYQNKHSSSAPHLYCGRGHPADFYSAENEMLVRFRSDERIQGTGFAITAQLLRACHRNFTHTSGRIMSSTLETCDTHITLPANYTIALYFARFSLYANDPTFNCSASAAPLRIFDDDRLARWECPGSVPMPFFSNSSRLTLRFTDIGVLSWINPMYDITYVASEVSGCGGVVSNYGGQLSSPAYPANERVARDCWWQLSVPRNQLVAVQFEVFDMGPATTCLDNYVELLELGRNGTQTSSRTFCGADTPAIFTAASSEVTVHFKKTVNFAGTGWLMNFMAVLPHANTPVY